MLARALRHLLHETFKALQTLFGHFALEFADALRLRDKAVASLLGEFRLNLEGRAERAHACELLEIGSRLFQRGPRVIAPGIRDGAIADRRVFVRRWNGRRSVVGSEKGRAVSVVTSATTISVTTSGAADLGDGRFGFNLFRSALRLIRFRNFAAAFWFRSRALSRSRALVLRRFGFPPALVSSELNIT